MSAVDSCVVSNPLKDQFQRPEGRLIERAMRMAGVSGRRLAEMVDLSEGRVRQIVNGYRTEAGQVLAIEGPTDTVVRMAEALNITAEEMLEAGREDVAKDLYEMPTVGVTEEGDLWLSSPEHEYDVLREWLANEPAGAPPLSVLRLWDVPELLEAARVRHQDEMRLQKYLTHRLMEMRKVDRAERERTEAHLDIMRVLDGPLPMAAHDDEPLSPQDEQDAGQE